MIVTLGKYVRCLCFSVVFILLFVLFYFCFFFFFLFNVRFRFSHCMSHRVISLSTATIHTSSSLFQLLKFAKKVIRTTRRIFKIDRAHRPLTFSSESHFSFCSSLFSIAIKANQEKKTKV